MQVHPGIRVMQIFVEMIDAAGVEGARSPYEAMHFVSLAQEKLRKV